jgi:hypothetical protein
MSYESGTVNGWTGNEVVSVGGFMIWGLTFEWRKYWWVGVVGVSACETPADSAFSQQGGPGI